MIYIVRHGQTDSNLKNICMGKKDIPLNSMGISQAEELKEELIKIKFDKVFSSPLKRAIQTAKIITNCKIETDIRLIERGMGQLEGKSNSEIKSIVNFMDEKEFGYGIEMLGEFKKRIFDFFDETIKEYVGKNVLIVTHGGVSVLTRCYFEGEPKESKYSDYKLKNCQIIKYNN